MTVKIVIAGTDTDVGKTVFAAALAGALGAYYWKPIQCGIAGGTDNETVAKLSGLPRENIRPEAYRFELAASPHLAAESDGLKIDPRDLDLPTVDGPLIVETAGGLMVPIRRDLLQVDVIATWQAPVILCARTSLGTINHSLLSIEALRLREVPIMGIAFIGDEQRDSERIICDMGGVRRLGRMPMLATLDRASVRAAFAEHFDILNIAVAGAQAA